MAMDVAIISTKDVSGGAAIAAHRLHRGLNEIGFYTRMVVRIKESGASEIEAVRPVDGLLSRPGQKLRYAHARREKPLLDAAEMRFSPFSTGRLPRRYDVVEVVGDADVVNLHWVSGMIDDAVFFRRLPKRTKIVWTLHDMNPMTGGCHYAWGCTLHDKACGRCPQLGEQKERDLSRRVWERKRKALSHISDDRLCVVALNPWMAEEARRSTLLGRFRVEIIPNGLDEELFAPPTDRAVSRAMLGLPADTPVVMFVADSLTDPRKGYSLLLKAIEAIHRTGSELSKRLHVLTIGANPPQTLSGQATTHLGRVVNEKLMAAAYGAADVFVTPALEDNLPNTVLESMACGTPVIGFRTGGVGWMIHPPYNGLLAKRGDVTELAGAIERLLLHPKHETAMRKVARKTILARHTQKQQAERYRALFESL